MASSLPIEIASTIQSASLNRSPSPHHDLNPSTAASTKQPVRISSPPTSPESPTSSRSRKSTNEIPYSAIQPLPRRSTLPPLPDLRFEQSYLASLQGKSDWKSITYITIRDQVLFPLLQGTLWTLALSGWRFWNQRAEFRGASVGSRIRRWWWEVNGWELPSKGEAGRGEERLAREVGEVSFTRWKGSARGGGIDGLVVL